MQVQVLDSYEKDGYHYFKITIPGAVNQPILKVPAGTKVTGAVGGGQCPIYPNHGLKSDGTCGRSGMCNAHGKTCPAK